MNAGSGFVVFLARAQALVRDGDPAVRRAAREALTRLSRSLPPSASEAEQHSVRQVLDAAVAASRDPNASSAGSGITKPFASVSRVLELHFRGVLTPDEVRKVLAEASHPLAAIFLLELLTKERGGEAAALAGPFVQSPEQQVRLACVEVLARIEGAEAQEHLAALAKDSDAEVAEMAAAAVARLAAGPPRHSGQVTSPRSRITSSSRRIVPAKRPPTNPVLIVVPAVLLAILLAAFVVSRPQETHWKMLSPVEPPPPSYAATSVTPSVQVTAPPEIIFASVSTPISIPNAAVTIEEVEANLAAAYAHKGLTSKPILRLMAIDWMQPAYRTAIAEARALANKAQFSEALRVLEEALAATESDHLTARITLLRSMDEIAREAGRFDLLPAFRKQLDELRKLLMDMVVQAAKEGGLPEAEVQKVMEKLENRQKESAKVSRTADWFSGRDFQSETQLAPEISPPPNAPPASQE